MVLKDIAMFHNRHRCQPLFNCCHNINQNKFIKQSTIPEMKEKHSATVCLPTSNESFDQYELYFSLINIYLKKKRKEIIKFLLFFLFLVK